MRDPDGSASSGSAPNRLHVTARPALPSVLRDLTARLLPLEGVEGLAQGEFEGRSCIRVFVRDDATAARLALPSTVEGYSVRVEVTDVLRARADPTGRPGRQ
jgi:hypothetical protein